MSHNKLFHGLWEVHVPCARSCGRRGHSPGGRSRADKAKWRRLCAASGGETSLRRDNRSAASTCVLHGESGLSRATRLTWCARTRPSATAYSRARRRLGCQDGGEKAVQLVQPIIHESEQAALELTGSRAARRSARCAAAMTKRSRRRRAISRPSSPRLCASTSATCSRPSRVPSRHSPRRRSSPRPAGRRAEAPGRPLPRSSTTSHNVALTLPPLAALRHARAREHVDARATETPAPARALAPFPCRPKKLLLSCALAEHAGEPLSSRAPPPAPPPL